jgi:hypothetical protein
MQIKITVIAFALSIAATSTLLASEIYRWTDEDGIVHYSDLPTGAAGEEHLAIRSRPTDLARVQAETQARVDTQSLREEEEANAPRGPTPEELRAETRSRQEKCNKYRARQTRFTENRRIYRMDEYGQRVYYDEEEMQAARAGVDDLVDEYCD